MKGIYPISTANRLYRLADLMLLSTFPEYGEQIYTRGLKAFAAFSSCSTAVKAS
ncbi:hypothetical protein HM1_2939 [Heliomicrobium modesticaldum Ice1]|uniref:Uncharacterized protein n=1 Tax=Heliobacterium modesticaldum (strain ATCC 51547 / Ice1) TaxID=498761 RepID=B0TCZ7_HELMI|nr:hypothetical protein HM1_2939 [Heliomicrobium modesticaldum Ice1]